MARDHFLLEKEVNLIVDVLLGLSMKVHISHPIVAGNSIWILLPHPLVLKIWHLVNSDAQHAAALTRFLASTSCFLDNSLLSGTLTIGELRGAHNLFLISPFLSPLLGTTCDSI